MGGAIYLREHRGNKTDDRRSRTAPGGLPCSRRRRAPDRIKSPKGREVTAGLLAVPLVPLLVGRSCTTGRAEAREAPMAAQLAGHDSGSAPLPFFPASSQLGRTAGIQSYI